MLVELSFDDCSSPHSFTRSLPPSPLIIVVVVTIIFENENVSVHFVLFVFVSLWNSIGEVNRVNHETSATKYQTITISAKRHSQNHSTTIRLFIHIKYAIATVFM